MIFVDYPGHLVAGLLLAGSAVLIVLAFRSSELLKATPRVRGEVSLGPSGRGTPAPGARANTPAKAGVKRHRLLLMLLQYAAVVILLLIAWNPSRSKVHDTFCRNSVLAVFDTSQSMSIAEDTQRSRLDKAVAAFTERFHSSDPFDKLRAGLRGPEYRVFGFDRQAYYSGSVGLLRRWGSHTDLHSAFALLDKYNDGNTDANVPTGVIIFTDGQAADRNVETYLPPTKKNCQIVLVGVGSRQPQRDVAIKSITAPSRVAIDTAYNVQVAVTAKGLKDDSVTIELLRDGHKIDNRQLKIENWDQSRIEPHEAVVEFTVGADTLGSHTLSARAKPLEKEANVANNLRSTVVEVAEEHKLKVLFYSQVANFNVGKVRQALARDDKIELDLGLDAIKNPALSEDVMRTCGYVKLPDRREEFYKYDIIILGPCDASGLTDAQACPELVERVDGLYSFVVDRGGGLILLPAKPPDQGRGLISPATGGRGAASIWTNEKVRSLLPAIIDLDKPPGQADNPGRIELTFEGIDSEIISQSDLTAQDVPISAYCRITSTKPAASTLATVGDTPVVCVHRVGRGRVCLLNISQLFLLYRQDRDGGLLQKLMSGLNSYVGRVANFEVGVELFAQRAGEGADKVRFSAYVCDKSFAPVSGANVLLNIKGQTLVMNQAGPGYYAAEIERAADETIVATAQAEINGTFLGEKTIAVNLPTVHTEMTDTELDEEFLAALAKKLNGKYFHADDLTRDSAQMFKAQVQTGSITRMTSIWPRWLLLLTLCVLLSINWYLRRAIGLV